AYVSKSGQSRDDILALLQDGDDHYYTGEEAIAAGFADAEGDALEDDAEADAAAHAFTASLLQRMHARGAPERYAYMAAVAALRSPHDAPRQKPAPAANRRPAAPAAAPTPNPPAPTAGHLPLADAGDHTKETAVMLTEE